MERSQTKVPIKHERVRAKMLSEGKDNVDVRSMPLQGRMQGEEVNEIFLP
jgi:hypothetical protein